MPIFGSGRVESGRVVFPDATVVQNAAPTTQSTASSTATGPIASSPSPVLTVTGSNVGSGAGLFAGSTGTRHVVLNFKSVIGGTGIDIVQDQDTITLVATGAVQTFVTFESLIDGPRDFVPQALLTTAANGTSLAWTPAATDAGTVLGFDGSGFVWQAPAATGVTSVSATGDNAITVGGGPVTNTGTLAFSLGNTAVAPGTYSLSTIVVDRQGRLTSAANGTAGASLQVTGSSAILANTSNGMVTLALANTGVTAGNYVLTTVTVDPQGRITAIANGTAGGSLQVTGDNAIHASTANGTVALSLANTGVAAGSYVLTTVTVDNQGRITAIANGSGGLGVNTTATLTGIVTGQRPAR